MSKKRNQKQGKKLSMTQFDVRFPDEASAIDFVEKCLWEDGIPICPKCDSNRSYRVKNRKCHRCLLCRKNFTVRMGTIFECSNLPLKTWLKGILLLEQQRLGISSSSLAGLLGVKQQTAWFLLHRLRDVCHIDARKADKLSKRTSVDEASFGGKTTNKHECDRTPGTQGGAGNVTIIAAVEEGGARRVQVIPDNTMSTKTKFVFEHIAEGTTVDTDKDGSLSVLGDVGYDHHRTNHSKGEHVIGDSTTNPVENLWSIMKRGMDGVYTHCSAEHLQRYADEYAYRLSECPVTMDSIDRMKVVVRAAAGHRLSYSDLIYNPYKIRMKRIKKEQAQLIGKFPPAVAEACLGHGKLEFCDATEDNIEIDKNADSINSVMQSIACTPIGVYFIYKCKETNQYMAYYENNNDAMICVSKNDMSTMSKARCHAHQHWNGILKEIQRNMEIRNTKRDEPPKEAASFL